jgi:hypothetical protein
MGSCCSPEAWGWVPEAIGTTLAARSASPRRHLDLHGLTKQTDHRFAEEIELLPFSQLAEELLGVTMKSAIVASSFMGTEWKPKGVRLKQS